MPCCYRHWRYGTAYCMIDRFLSELTNAASIFTLTVTSYDRYSGIQFLTSRYIERNMGDPIDPKLMGTSKRQGSHL
jgi:hypothetical protein